jgi:hypothetical protein
MVVRSRTPSDPATILRHDDNHLYPTWLNGGLYNLRWDVGADTDADGNWTFMDPFSSNAAIGYVRLKLPDGQKVMCEHPWTKENIASRLWIENVDLDDEVDALRGFWEYRPH